MSKTGLINSLNVVRSTSSNDYQSTIPVLTEDSGIETISTPLLQYPTIMNEFISNLVQKISYSQLETKIFNNPLSILEGEALPLGAIGEEIYINPAEGRDYDINDFAGLLSKYESDVKVQYQQINLDEQFPVTIIRQKLKQAFMSWKALEDFIANITTSLYNGCYIRQYNVTKALVANAYRENGVQICKLQNPNTEELAKNFLTKAREYFMNFQTPSSLFNAWSKVGGYGRDIITWSNKQDIVLLIRNDILAYNDVNVLASAFNIDKTSFIGNVIGVNDFNIYNKKNEIVFDGSNILGIICDKAWFKIKQQDMYMEDFRNANNRSMQYYLNLIKMFSYSFFANAVVFATEDPSVTINGIEFINQSPTVNKDEEITLQIKTTPFNATTPDVSFTTDDSTYITVTKIDNRSCKVTGVSAGSGTVKATAGNVSKEIEVTVTDTE